jgi:hypothetical protein
MGQTPGERLYLKDDPELGVKANRKRAVIDRHIERYEWAIKAANRISGVWVDFACGSGYGTELIHTVADTAIGVDGSALAITYARKHYDALYHVGGPELWFSPDVVVSIETLEHLPRAAQSAWITEVGIHLQPDGVFLLTCPIGDDGPNPANPWHLWEPSIESLRRILHAQFGRLDIQTEGYTNTAGQAARQAYCVCREPRAHLDRFVPVPDSVPPVLSGYGTAA